MNDEQLIEEGRKAAQDIGNRQMELGRLCLEFAPIGERGVNVGTKERVKMYAEKIGVPMTTLRNYRNVAHAWDSKEVYGIRYAYLHTLMAAGDKDAAWVLAKEATDKGLTAEQLKEAAVKAKVLPEPKVKKKRTTNIATIATNLAELTADDFDRTKDKETVQMLNRIAKEVKRLQALVEKPVTA